MELRQELKLRQTLSQNMIQSTAILQMGQMELREYLEELCLENPVIDLEELSGEKERVEQETVREQDEIYRLEELASLDAQNRSYYEYEAEEERRFDPGMEIFTMEHALLEQIFTLSLSGEQERAIKYMILNLDEDGYLREDFSAICRELGISLEKGEEAWSFFRLLEPRGIGARNLPECLMMQLEQSGDAGSAVGKLAGRLIEECLEELAENRITATAKKLGCSISDILEAGALIRSFNPRPAAGFGDKRYERYLLPDVIIKKTEHGLQVCLADNGLFQLHINPYYVSLMKQAEFPEAQEYLKEKIRQAEWTCHCLEQRNATLLQLTAILLEEQPEFFEKGRIGLKPMTQKKMAERLGISESTVSRTVREKYLQCRFGVFPLQYFFSRSDVPEAIRERMRELIKQEDKRKPFSDRVLAERLMEEGMDISRRTVAKYREEMGIRDARGRKEFIGETERAGGKNG